MDERALASGASVWTRTSPGSPVTLASRKITRSAVAISAASSAVRMWRAMTLTSRGSGAAIRASAARGPMASSPRMGLP